MVYECPPQMPHLSSVLTSPALRLLLTEAPEKSSLMAKTSTPPTLREPVRRTRTPPDLKWMLNERAALAGVVQKAATQQTALNAKQLRLEQQLQVVFNALARSRRVQEKAQMSICALDATMELMHSRAEPTSAGVVDAWAGKYGKRGALGDFIGQILKQAAPESVTTTVLINLAAAHFGLVFLVPADRRSFRQSVRSALGSLLKRSLAEPKHDKSASCHGVWAWSLEVNTLSALRQQAASVQGTGA